MVSWKAGRELINRTQKSKIFSKKKNSQITDFPEIGKPNTSICTQPCFPNSNIEYQQLIPCHTTNWNNPKKAKKKTKMKSLKRRLLISQIRERSDVKIFIGKVLKSWSTNKQTFSKWEKITLLAYRPTHCTWQKTLHIYLTQKSRNEIKIKLFNY